MKALGMSSISKSRVSTLCEGLHEADLGRLHSSSDFEVLSPRQRSCPSRDRSCSSPERSPARPYQLTALTVRTAIVPQITPIKTLRVPSPVHHSTPRLTNNVTAINTTMDKSTVAANFDSIPIPLDAYASLWCPNPLRCRAVIRATAPHRCRSSTTPGRTPRVVGSPALRGGWSR